MVGRHGVGEAVSETREADLVRELERRRRDVPHVVDTLPHASLNNIRKFS